MGQLTFFEADRRLAALSKKGDPLEAIAGLVPGALPRQHPGCSIDAGGGEEESSALDLSEHQRK